MAADTLADLVIRIRSDTSGFRTGGVVQGLGVMNTRLQTASRNLRQFGGRMRTAGIRASTFMTLPILAGANAATSAAESLEESVNAVNQVFGDASGTIRRFGETSSDSVGLSTRAFQQAVTPIGAALQNYGLSADQAADESINLTQRASDLASVFDTDVDDALTAIQAGLRGEADPLEQFGVNLSAAAVEAEALAMGVNGSWSEMTDQERTMARLSLLFKQSESVAGDFRDTVDGTANSQRVLTSRTEDAAAAFGKNLLPVKAKLQEVATKLLNAFNNLSPGMQKLVLGAIAAAAALGPLLTIGGALVSVLGLLISPVGLAIAALVALAAVVINATVGFDGLREMAEDLVEWGKANWPGFRDAVLDAFNAVSDWISEMWPGVRDAIMDVFFTVKAWVDENWPTIRDTILDVLDQIVSWVDEHWPAIQETITNVLTIVREVVGITLDWIRDKWDTWGSVIMEVVGFVWASIKSTIEFALELIRGVITTVTGLITGDWSMAWEGIKMIFSAAWGFMTRSVALLGDLFLIAVEAVWTLIKDSASTAWDDIKSTAKGAWEDIKDAVLGVMRSLLRGASAIWDAIVRAARGPLNSVIGFVNTLIDGLNAVLRLIPGVDQGPLSHISEIGEPRNASPGRPDVRSTRAWRGLAAGGLLDPVGPGFMTSGPAAIVGEGRPQHPEFVIPTDPQHRVNAMSLLAAASNKIMPRMAIGGILDNAFDMGADFAGGLLGRPGATAGTPILVRNMLTEAFDPVAREVIDGLADLPDVFKMATAASGVAGQIWEWVKGADSALPKLPPKLAGSFGGGPGVEQWRDMALQALAYTGSPLSWINSLMRRMAQESGGNPKAINLWDRNAQNGVPSQGLMQTIPPTFNAHAGELRGRGILDPFANIVAAIRYTISRYGSGPAGWDQAGGYDVGGIVGNRGGRVHPGEMVLTQADQTTLFKLLREGGSSGMMVGTVNITVMAERGMSEIDAERQGRAAGRGFQAEINKRRVRADAKLR